MKRLYFSKAAASTARCSSSMFSNRPKIGLADEPSFAASARAVTAFAPPSAVSASAASTISSRVNRNFGGIVSLL